MPSEQELRARLLKRKHEDTEARMRARKRRFAESSPALRKTETLEQQIAEVEAFVSDLEAGLSEQDKAEIEREVREDLWNIDAAVRRIEQFVADVVADRSF